MNRPQQAHIWLAGAVLTVLLGLAWSLQTLRQYPHTRNQLKQQMAQYERLQAMRTEKAAQAAWMDQLTAPPAAFTNPEQILRDQFPRLNRQVRWIQEPTAGPAWQLSRIEIVLADAPATAIGHLLYVLETQRPPWRLIEGEVRAADSTPENVQARLIFDGLAKGD
jgi:hypothetical protein